MKCWLSLNFGRPCAAWAGQRSRLSSQALLQNPTAAAVRPRRGCERLPAAWVPATISHPCQAHISCSQAGKQWNRWWLPPFSGILETHQSTHRGTKRKERKKNLKMWCRTEKWWFENGWAQEKARRGARYGGLHVRRKPGTWERKPGTLCSARSGYSQEADTRQDWPSLATQSAHSFLQRFWS